MSGTTLKWIAVISMLIDHTAEVLINHNAALTDPIWAQIYVLMRGIGRIAFPIYAFLLVEGFLHTRDVKKYLARMLTFAVVSEIPFDLAVFHTPFTGDTRMCFLRCFWDYWRWRERTWFIRAAECLRVQVCGSRRLS